MNFRIDHFLYVFILMVSFQYRTELYNAYGSSEEIYDKLVIVSMYGIIIICFLALSYNIYKYVYDNYINTSDYNTLVIEIDYKNNDHDEIMNKYKIIHNHITEILPTTTSVQVSLNKNTDKE